MLVQWEIQSELCKFCKSILNTVNRKGKMNSRITVIEMPSPS